MVGRGLMPEAIGAVTRWALGLPSVAQVSAVCDVENRASARALEKSGFIKRGLRKEHSVHPNISPLPRDCYFYAVNREADA
jgi:ribosomal-protein-alanine N-acetyltransferase